jgi:hypothetical protein
MFSFFERVVRYELSHFFYFFIPNFEIEEREEGGRRRGKKKKKCNWNCIIVRSYLFFEAN